MAISRNLAEMMIWLTETPTSALHLLSVHGSEVAQSLKATNSLSLSSSELLAPDGGIEQLIILSGRCPAVFLRSAHLHNHLDKQSEGGNTQSGSQVSHCADSIVPTATKAVIG